jgi:hypothetical protein
MRLYRIDIRDRDDGNVVSWETSKARAAEELREMLKDRNLMDLESFSIETWIRFVAF